MAVRCGADAIKFQKNINSNIQVEKIDNNTW